MRRIEAEKEIWSNKFVEDTAKNNFDHVVTLKIHESFTVQRDTLSKCQIYIMNWIVHGHKCLSSFLFFRFFKLRERERERGWYIKFGYKEK